MTWQSMLAAVLTSVFSDEVRAHESLVQSADKDFSSRSLPHFSLFQPLETAVCSTATFL